MAARRLVDDLVSQIDRAARAIFDSIPTTTYRSVISMTMNEVDAALERYKALGEELKAQLMGERNSLMQRLELVDQRLASMGAAPVKRTYKARTPREIVKLSDDFAIPPAGDPPPPGDSVAEALVALRPYWPKIPNGRDRAVIEMRAKGKLPAEIGAALKIDNGAVSNIVFRVRGVLQTARDADKSPASDSDEEP